MADQISAHVRQPDGEQTEFTVLVASGEETNNNDNKENHVKVR